MIKWNEVFEAEQLEIDFKSIQHVSEVDVEVLAAQADILAESHARRIAQLPSSGRASYEAERMGVPGSRRYAAMTGHKKDV